MLNLMWKEKHKFKKTITQLSENNLKRFSNFSYSVHIGATSFGSQNRNRLTFLKTSVQIYNVFDKIRFSSMSDSKAKDLVAKEREQVSLSMKFLPLLGAKKLEEV